MYRPKKLTPPTLATREQDPTPALRRYVGINSDVHIHSIANVEDAQKLLIMLKITIGIVLGNGSLIHMLG